MEIKLYMIWSAVMFIITARTLVVASYEAKNPNKLLAWFRYENSKFRATLGILSLYLAWAAYLDGAYAWTIGNIVFGFSAWINFDAHQENKLVRGIKSVLSHPNGSFFVFIVIPTVIFAICMSDKKIYH